MYLQKLGEERGRPNNLAHQNGQGLLEVLEPQGHPLDLVDLREKTLGWIGFGWVVAGGSGRGRGAGRRRARRGGGPRRDILRRTAGTAEGHDEVGPPGPVRLPGLPRPPGLVPGDNIVGQFLFPENES